MIFLEVLGSAQGVHAVIRPGNSRVRIFCSQTGERMSNTRSGKRKVCDIQSSLKRILLYIGHDTGREAEVGSPPALTAKHLRRNRCTEHHKTDKHQREDIFEYFFFISVSVYLGKSLKLVLYST